MSSSSAYRKMTFVDAPKLLLVRQRHEHLPPRVLRRRVAQTRLRRSGPPVDMSLAGRKRHSNEEVCETCETLLCFIFIFQSGSLLSISSLERREVRESQTPQKPNDTHATACVIEDTLKRRGMCSSYSFSLPHMDL